MQRLAEELRRSGRAAVVLNDGFREARLVSRPSTSFINVRLTTYAMPLVVDLNNALVSFILTGYEGFTTSAGYVGPHFRVDHDISLLVPEIWRRMLVHERDPGFLLANGYLEKVRDFCLDGRTVLASRLGYRTTALFVDRFLGRIFETPDAVFSEEMLCPEKQDIVQFAAGVDAIVEAQTQVARQYFEDGSVESACPPLQALLHIMANGSYHGKGVELDIERRLAESRQ